MRRPCSAAPSGSSSPRASQASGRATRSASANGAATLAEAFPGRFVLTLGVSHAPIVTRRGHAYDPPLTAMREHLDGMAATRYVAPAPAEPAPLLLAALAPGMMRLAAERADGAHPYLVTPDAHRGGAGDARAGEDPRSRAGRGRFRTTPTRRARLPGSTSPSTSRMENYTRCWRRLGFGEADLADGGSDRLVDALVAWGDEQAVAARVRAHLDAGADHVPVQALGADPLAQLERLAPVLTALAPG